MAEPFTLRSRHPLGLQQRFISRWRGRIPLSAVASVKV
jgi:hypothetical protein